MTAASNARLLTVLRWMQACAGLALACVACIPTRTLAEFFEHPARPGNEGDAILNATVQGAQLLRVFAPIAGLALAALALWGDRLFARSSHAADARFTPAQSLAPLPAMGSLAPATRVDAQFIFVAIAIAIAVRVPLLTQSLWYDEIAAFLGYGLYGPGVAMGNYYTQANHVLQSVLSACSAWLLGVNEVSLRLPSLLVGIAAVPAAWWLGREAGSAAAARGAALAMALMPVAVLESTEARGYAFMAYYATLATASLLWARRMNSGVAWAEYAIICALGGWSHLVTLCVPAFHGLWSAIALLRAQHPQQRCQALGALIALVVAAMLTLALYAPILPDMANIRRDFTASDGNEPVLVGAQGLMMLQMLGGAWTWWATLAGVPLIVAGVVAARKNRSLALALCLALGGLLIALLAPMLNGWLYARFLTFMVPAVALAAGAGGALLISWRPRIGVALVAIAATAWVACVLLLPPRQPLREGVEYIAAHRQPQDTAVAIGLPDEVQQLYATAHGLSIPGTGPYGMHFEKAVQTLNPRWVLMLYPRAMSPRLLEQLRSFGYAPVAHWPGWIDQGDGEVTVYEHSRSQGLTPR